MIETFELTSLAPELFLVAATLLLLLAGLAVRPQWSGIIHYGAIAVLGVAMLAVGTPDATWNVAFHGMVIDDAFGRFSKLLILGGVIGSLLIGRAYQKQHQIAQFEYPVLVLLATVGMMLMVSAHDFLSLYMGLELQSLALYVLAAFRRDDAMASEAGLKYFVLGALSSGLLLFGISLIYGLTGNTGFTALQLYFGMSAASGMGYVALVLVLAAIAFKISAAPFHMWTPDVYQGAPTSVTAFLAAAPKVAAFALLTRLLMQPLHGLGADWQQILMFLAIASMVVGGFAAIMQSSLKRLLAYSTIAHVGYILAGLAAGNAMGAQAVMVYLAIYLVNTLGVFAVVLALQSRDRVSLDKIADLAGLAKQRPSLAFAMTVFMFSLAGVPPLAGFYGKFYVFATAWQAGLQPLVFIGLLASAVAAYYYLRIIKLMYFDEPTHGGEVIHPITAKSLQFVLMVAVLLTLFLGLHPTPLLDIAKIAGDAVVQTR